MAKARISPAFGGTVLNGHNQGIANVVVKMTPIGESLPAPVYARTDVNGRFLFWRLSGGEYIFDVVSGNRLIHRESIDVSSHRRVVVQILQVP